jgi:hypothetical protein
LRMLMRFELTTHVLRFGSQSKDSPQWSPVAASLKIQLNELVCSDTFVVG